MQIKLLVVALVEFVKVYGFLGDVEDWTEL